MKRQDFIYLSMIPIFILLACSSDSGTGSSSESLASTSSSGDVVNGEQIYRARCVPCHGQNGEGVEKKRLIIFGPSLRNCNACDSFDSLLEQIDGRMPPGSSRNLCRDDCARDTTAYILEAFN